MPDRTGSGIEQSDLPRDELFRGLIEEFVLAEEIVTRLAEALDRLAG